MSYDMKDPKQRAIAVDRRAAGIGPIRGDEITRRRELESASKPLTPSNPDALRRKRLVADLERMRREPVLRRVPGQQVFLPLLSASTVPPATASPTITPRAKPPIDPSSMAEVPAFHREPDWSEASDDEQYDPASILPYCPRWNISTRRLDAIWTAATTTTPETLAALEKEQARLAANSAQALRALKTRAIAEQTAVAVVAQEITRMFLEDDIIANARGPEVFTVYFVRTFSEALAYLGDAGVSDNVNFWVVNGDPAVYPSSAAAFQAWKDAKDPWAGIYVTSLEADAETYALQFDQE
ncbi:hypothetical protein B0H14DRAFT_3894401 [Mycena olivaceomarginata]|nr:hypothetical protein B0H14DRAFT_3894401 [Mycena olivaceomarginata]